MICLAENLEQNSEPKNTNYKYYDIKKENYNYRENNPYYKYKLSERSHSSLESQSKGNNKPIN